jgi:AraC family transcriptional regulator
MGEHSPRGEVISDMSSLSDRPQLGHGAWFGKELGSCTVRGFCLSELQPEAWGDELPEHSHSDTHLILPVRGKYVSSAAGAPAICTPSVLIYNPPGVIHRDRFESPTGLFVGLSISKDRLAEIGPVRLPQDALAFQDLEIVSLAHAARNERRHWDSSSSLIVEGLVVELLGRIGRVLNRADVAVPSWFGSVMDCMRDNLSNEVTLKALANVAEVSQSELSRAFHRFMKCSPGAFIRARRMEVARNLLKSRTPLVEIGPLVGFADQSAFSKAFRKAHGYSPGSYRRLISR